MKVVCVFLSLLPLTRRLKGSAAAVFSSPLQHHLDLMFWARRRRMKDRDRESKGYKYFIDTQFTVVLHNIVGTYASKFLKPVFKLKFEMAKIVHVTKIAIILIFNF